MAEIHCRHFNGYKPCARSGVCERGACASYSSVGARVLIVHLEALGAVLRSTALLAAIHRKYPGAMVTWVTKAPGDRLLENVPGIDRVLTLSADDLLKLRALRFDVALVVDKSLAACGVMESVRAEETLGFRANPVNGAIVPATPAAVELWQMGLDNHRKFFVNEKTEQQLVHEALNLGAFQRDEYRVELSHSELSLAAARRAVWSPDGGPVIGLNTGCAATLPAKKLSVRNHRALISRLLRDSALGGCSIVLLGGPEDTERNDEIARGLPVVLSPTTKGLRDGFASLAACDLVVSGDSLGMHMAIALKRWVVAWFGPTCAQEIDLYDRGVKVRSHAPCSPCWKRACGQKVMCYDQVDFDLIVDGLKQGLTWLTSSSKPRSPETSFSPSP
ncbi:MAG TPA: glycosyltransferase family 9 protein [Bdellovibrionales bacterium]|nr:glycosyltransferase family 9 protein [Bdellovibrionales bacterium]